MLTGEIGHLASKESVDLPSSNDVWPMAANRRFCCRHGGLDGASADPLLADLRD
jgi:hypothetical protein